MMLHQSKHLSVVTKVASETISELFESHPAINPEFWSPGLRMDRRVALFSDLPTRFTTLLESTSAGADYLRTRGNYLLESYFPVSTPSAVPSSNSQSTDMQSRRKMEVTSAFSNDFWRVVNELRSTIFVGDTFPKVFRDAELVADILNGVFLKGSRFTPWWDTVISDDALRAAEAHRRLSSDRKHQADFGCQVLIGEVLTEYGVNISGRLFPE